AGQPAAASRGGGTGGRTGRGGGRTGGRSGDQSDGRNEGQGGQVGSQGREVNDGVDGVPDFSTIIAQQLQNLLPTIVVQVGDQGRGQGIGRNQNGDAANDHIQGDVGNVIENNDLYTRWIEKIESVKDMNGCGDNQKVKYTAGSFVGKALTWWNSQIRTLGREVAVGMSRDNFKALTREEFCPSNKMQKLVPHLVTLENRRIERYIAGTLTDKALRNGSIKKNPKKRVNGGEPSKDRNVRDDNKRTRTGNAFATTTNPVGRENTGYFAKDCRVAPRNVNPVNARNPAARACYECDSTDHIRSACPRLNRAQGQRGNRLNQALANNGGQGRGNQGNQERGRAFMLGVEEARQDPNIVTKPSDLGFSYEIEIASGQLVEIDKVIRGCKLEIEGHVFDIDLIPFGSGSFDVIIEMDWLSDHKAEIICHEKVVTIPLLDGKVLRVLGEKPEEKMRQLMSAKAKEKKQEEIVVVRNFLEVFPDDLSGLPPVREIEFQIELIPGAMSVAKFLYCLAPSELEELSGQLKEL
ncbi:putative reverse transcriptase domain-containing protein, partial [Tanacetum coccineum]